MARHPARRVTLKISAFDVFDQRMRNERCTAPCDADADTGLAVPDGLDRPAAAEG